CSISAIARETAGCEIASSTAAFAMLPRCATTSRICRSRSFRRRRARSMCCMSDPIKTVMEPSHSNIGRVCPPQAFSLGDKLRPIVAAAAAEPERHSMMTRRHLLTVSAASVVFSCAGVVPRAIAQSRLTSAHVLTGYTPGLPDAVARLIADQMKDYAASIVVETRPGASGRVAVEAVKAADADGSIILFAPL